MTGARDNEIDRLRRLLDQVQEENAELRVLRDQDRMDYEMSRQVVQTSVLGVLCLDASGKIVLSNPAAAQILGLSPDELDGRTPHDPRWRAIHEDGSDWPGAAHPVAVALETGREVRGAVMGVFNPEMDSYKWITIDAVPTFQEGEPRPIWVHATFRDITEQLAAQERNRLLVDLVNTTPASISVHDTKGRFLFVNDATAAMHGYAKEQLLTMTLADLYPRQSASIVEERMKRLLEAGQASFETEHLRKDGTVLPLHVDARMARWRETDVVLSVATDLTGRRAGEQALRESEERFRQLAENISEVFWVGTPDWSRILYVSPAYELLAGPGSTAQLYEDPSSLLEYVADEDRAMLRKAIIEGAAQGWSNPTLPTFRVYGADDDLHWMSARVFPVRDANGAIYRVAGIAEDISQRVKAEEEHLALERQVLEARAAESLGVLAGGIAHDFNNLLMGVLGNLELVALDLPPDSPVLPSLDSAVKAAQRASELSGQMLLYSGKSILSPTQLELSAFVRENTGILQAALSPGSILVTETAPDLPRISADAGQIQRALVNLVTNAAEALSDGHGTVTVSTGVKDCDAGYLSQSRLLDQPDPGRYVWVQVTDTGRGMDMATQTRLFDPFFTTKFTGRGLGMPAVMGTVRAHGGAVLVDSTLGLGTTVRILLPAAAAGAELAEGQSASLQLEERPPASGGPQIAPGPRARRSSTGAEGPLVLIVDDEEMVRRVCTRSLSRSKFRTLEAEDGTTAMRIFQEHVNEIDAVVMDLTMPGLDGLALFTLMRGTRPDVPVILCSGYDEKEAMRRFGAGGPSGFLQKPFSLEALLATLGRVLET